MRIDLPPDTEALLRKQAMAVGLTVEEFAARKLDELVEEERSPVKNHQAWIAAVRSWSESHPDVKHEIDDSRETIYQGRGE